MKKIRKYFLVMLITILTAFAFLNSVSSSAASTSWNFKNTGFKDLGTISSSVTVDNLQMNATSAKTMTVKANSVTVNGTSFTYCLALGGAGSTSYRNVKVPVSGASTIKVTLDAAATRTLVVSNSSGSQIGTITATTTAATQSVKYSGSSGYVYLWSSNSNINIYKIQVDSSSDSGSGSSSGGSSSGSSGGSTTVTGKSVTMNGTKYSTIQAALNAATGSSSYTIKLGEGTYNECLYYKGSATIKIQGQTSSAYGANVKISAANSQTLKKLSQASSTQKARCLFEFEGSGNLILESITLENTFVRPSLTATETQAETIGFDSTGTLSACNCSFKSHQDTIRTSSKCWFYKCYVEGDTDFIWSERTGRVALFEECKIKSIYDSNTSYHESFVAAPRMDVTSTASKGVVFLNCSVESDSRNKTYLARTPWSSGYYNQVAYINCSMSNVKNVWYGSQISTNYDVTDIGWKLDSKTASNLGVSGKSYVMSDSKKSSEYGDRTKIMNRYFDTSSRSYKSESNGWDLNSFATNMGWISGGSSSGGSSSGSGSSGGSTTSGTTITVKSGGTSLASALKSAKSGTTIIIDGTVTSGAVQVPSGVNISGKNNAKIDFSQTSGSSGRGLTFKGNGSTVQNITVTKASDNGIYIEGSNNTFKYVTCTRNGDAGFQISNGGANNKFYNCNSTYNCDAKGENADGFAVKLHSGEGNYFENCVAEYNSDDGWDCYAAHGAVTLINCQANYNGYCDGIYGDGNGFKMGGVDNKTSGVAAHLDPLNHYLKGCTAKGNYASGFDRNNQSGVVTMENCIADGNKKKNYNWPAKGKPSALGYEVTFGKAIIKNCTSKNGSNNISGATLQGTNTGF